MNFIKKKRRISILPCECPPCPRAPNVENWLTQNHAIRDAIIWQAPEGDQPYETWSSSKKQELQDALELAIYLVSNWEVGELVDPPPNKLSFADDEPVSTVLEEAHAWPLFLAYTAHSLAFEIADYVPWSIADYSSQQLSLLFNSREMFLWVSNHNGYSIQFMHGTVVPAPPNRTYFFLRENELISSNRLNTIAQILDWCRQNLVHFMGGREAKNMEDQWQYRGFPPVSRIIEGTPFIGHPEWGVSHRTAGCWGTTGFLRAVLRVVNIPAKLVSSCGHAMPHFTTEDKYLSHGDDPYNALSKSTPPFPAEELLIDQTKYNDWFGNSVSQEDKCNNIGRRTRELAIEHLPNYLLHKRCSDIEQGNPHETSLVYEIFRRNYTVQELEAANLWERMDAKIASFGGCDDIP